MRDKRIYVIDDDAVMRMSCQQILEKEEYCVEIFEDGEKGLQRIGENKPDLMLVDLKMPKIGGLEVIARVHEIDPDIVIIVITGYATVDTAVEAMKAGAYDFLPKPFTPDELRLIVNRALERQHLIEESTRLRNEKEKMQRQFITFVSHQLQSPLVAVQQYLDVLKNLGKSPNIAELQQQWIDRSCIKIKELLTLIRDWLRISKIESGALAGKAKKVDLSPLLREILNTYEKTACEKGISINLNKADSISPVKADDECLTVLISNLIDNAIKYNKPNGSISVTVTEKNDHVSMIVSDTGIGISPENIKMLFQEFHRVKDETTKNISGTGLGLTICKKIIIEMGGDISIQSELGRGSTFTVNLPKYKD